MLKKQQVFIANSAVEILKNSLKDQWRQVNGVKKPADIWTQGMFIEGLQGSVMATKRWRKVAKAAVSRERRRIPASYQYCTGRSTNWAICLEQPQQLQWIPKLFYLLHEVQDELEGTSQSIRDPSSRANIVSSCSNRKLHERFKTDHKQQRISKTLNIDKLSLLIEEYWTIRAKCRLQHLNFDYNAEKPILLTANHPVAQNLLRRTFRNNIKEETRLKQSSRGLLDCCTE